MKRAALFILGASLLSPLGCGPSKVAEKPPMIEPDNRVVMIQPPDNPGDNKPIQLLAPSAKDLQEEDARVKSLEPVSPGASSPSASEPPAKSSAPADKSLTQPVPKPEHLIKDPGGYQYQDVVVGKGKSPKKGQTVTVNYTGWLADGKQFDSTNIHGPFSFRLDEKEVIEGWDLGIASMKVGGKRILVIPPNLAYGAGGNPPTIPPNATLTFEVELLSVGG
jgi:FKBP-type peptidyl-prolyl cis-trans isomerase